VSSVWFLSPDADAAAQGASARGPMHGLARAAGAQFEQRGGWEIATAYGADARPGVAFADRSHLTKLELQAEPAMLARIVAEASGGLVLEPGAAGRSNGTWWCPVTPSRVLVLGEPEHSERLHATLAEAIAGAGDATTTVTDVSTGLVAMNLLGEHSGELLARFCAIDVRPAVTPATGFRPGSVARTPGYVLKETDDRLLVLVGWAFGEYLWQVVADAAEHLGGGPVGEDALAPLPEGAGAHA
jgi:heterotetrameric sarcosine oxidase gamma subunit